MKIVNRLNQIAMLIFLMMSAQSAVANPRVSFVDPGPDDGEEVSGDYPIVVSVAPPSNNLTVDFIEPDQSRLQHDSTDADGIYRGLYNTCRRPNGPRTVYTDSGYMGFGDSVLVNINNGKPGNITKVSFGDLLFEGGDNSNPNDPSCSEDTQTVGVSFPIIYEQQEGGYPCVNSEPKRDIEATYLIVQIRKIEPVIPSGGAPPACIEAGMGECGIDPTLFNNGVYAYPLSKDHETVIRLEGFKRFHNGYRFIALGVVYANMEVYTFKKGEGPIKIANGYCSYEVGQGQTCCPPPPRMLPPRYRPRSPNQPEVPRSPEEPEIPGPDPQTPDPSETEEEERYLIPKTTFKELLEKQPEPVLVGPDGISHPSIIPMQLKDLEGSPSLPENQQSVLVFFKYGWDLILGRIANQGSVAPVVVSSLLNTKNQSLEVFSLNQATKEWMEVEWITTDTFVMQQEGLHVVTSEGSDAPPASETINEAFEIRDSYLYPNPTTNSKTATFFADVSGGAKSGKLYVSDVTGKVVLTIEVGAPNAIKDGREVYEIPISTNDKAPGIYTVDFHVDNGSEKKRVKEQWAIVK